MGKSKVEKTLRDSLSTINDLRREVKKVRKAGEKAVAQQFEKATSSSASEIAKLREELDRVRESTSKQIADLTAEVARLKSSRGSSSAADGQDAPVERPHGDPLREAAHEATPGPAKKAAKKAPATKSAAKKTAAKKAPATDTTDDRLTLKGEALAASEGVSAVDEDAPGTAPTSEVTTPGSAPRGGDAPTVDRDSVAPVTGEPATTTATTSAKTRAASTGGSAAKNAAEATTKSKPPAGTKKAAAKKTTTAKKTSAAKKAPAKTPGTKSTAQRGGSGGQKTTARKAQPAKKSSTTRATPPASTPSNPASADRPASD